ESHGSQHFNDDTTRGDPGADTLASGVDRRGDTGRPGTDDEHVEGLLVADLLSGPLCGSTVEFAQNLLKGHPTLLEVFTVEEHGGHREHAPGLDLVLEQGTVDGHVLDPRVDHAHEVERLDDLGTVLTGQ